MPYNNTPITPQNEITGTVSLPLARVKKIINADDEIANCSNNAAFVITAATEMFLQYLVEQSYNIVKSERKPRRNVQYRDVANAIARVENLEFLSDVVPKTTTYKAVKQKQAKEPGTAQANGGLEKGQSTLAGHMEGARDSEEGQATNGAAHEKIELDGAVDDDDDSEGTVDQPEDDRDGTRSPPEEQEGEAAERMEE